MDNLQALATEYDSLLSQQTFIAQDLDYTLIDKHKPMLDSLARVNNSGITVFDLFKKEHLYTSYNFSEIFGYDLAAIEAQGNEYFNARVHPDDFVKLLKNGISIIKFYFKMPPAERVSYKFVNEYRILGKEGTYIRVIEQHQALELDIHGNVWLALGVIDVSPDQSESASLKSQIYNYKTGKVYSLPPVQEPFPGLSGRELEVLHYVKDGLLSKEISERLSISVHTVNTHRQRILQKLGANNSLEAIHFAASLGLVKSS
jgi:DNA-binding CsgD family transcriptional regulator